jgi:hypothetical protein
LIKRKNVNNYSQIILFKRQTIEIDKNYKMQKVSAKQGLVQAALTFFVDI